MVTHTNNLQLDPSRQRVRLRLRPDLQVSEQSYRGGRCWVIKDPVALEYFRFREHEFAILQMLDGRTSLDEVKAQFQAAFAPRQVSVTGLHSFLATLHRNGLLLSDHSGQGEQLLLRHGRRRSEAWLSTLFSVLAIRFRGFDPEPLLRWLQPRCRFLFSYWFLTLSVALMVVAVVLVAGRWGELESRWPGMDAFISHRNLMWLAAALILTKICHEFGHALTCKAFGGECHELGLLLLVFTPCLYCDVSDSWMLSSRWKRMAVVAAGIWVELTLAAICTFGWWYTRPGLLNSLCLNMMVVCTVGTVLINGNPLLRYDGYYLLSDLLDVPNLWGNSRAVVRRSLGYWLWGVAEEQATDDRREFGLLLYGVASMVYRVFVLILVLYLVHRTLVPLGLQVVAQLLAATVAVSLFVGVVGPMRRSVFNHQWRSRANPLRIAISCSLLLAVCLSCCLLPLPCHLQVPVVLQPSDAQPVYVSVAGRLVDAIGVGEDVTAGQVLARLENSELAREVVDLQGQVERQRVRVRSFDALRVTDPSVAHQLPGAKQILSDLEIVLDEKLKEQRALVLRAPCAGVVLPPASIPESDSGTVLLGRWSGVPLEKHNLGCMLQRATQLCLVGDARHFEAVLMVDQADIGFVRQGQKVRLRLDMHPGRIVTGTVRDIARRELQAVPAQLSVLRELPSKYDSAGVARPLDSAYQVRVHLEETDLPLVIDARGRAKIRIESQTLGYRISRFIARTFRIRH